MVLFSFPFLFPSFGHSVIYRVVSIVSDGRNQFSFVFSYVGFESLYGCVTAVFIIIPCEFSAPELADGPSVESEWQHVSSVLNILANFNDAGVWMVSIHPPISNFSSLFNKPLGIFPRAWIKIGTSINSVFLAFLVLCHDPSIVSHFTLLFYTHWSIGMTSSLFSFTIAKSGVLV